MPEMIKVFKIDIPDDSTSIPLYLESLEDVKDQIDNLFWDCDQPTAGGTYRIELTEMDRAEFEALPEWDGF